MVPRPKEYRASGDTLVLGTAQTAAIVVAPGASEQELYAASRLQTHIERRFKQTFPVLTTDKLDGAVKQVYEFSGTLMEGMPFNGFTIAFAKRNDVDWITIRGADMGGLIYGGEAFFDLIKKDADGVAKVTVAAVKDWPSIPWRGRPHSVMAQQIQPGQLDAFVHARINYSDFRDNPDQPATVKMDAQIVDGLPSRQADRYGIVPPRLQGVQETGVFCVWNRFLPTAGRRLFETDPDV